MKDFGCDLVIRHRFGIFFKITTVLHLRASAEKFPGKGAIEKRPKIAKKTEK